MTNLELLDELSSGKSVLGFSLSQVKFIEELSCKMWVLSHRGSGAVLAFFDSGDEERCFSISFPACPKDDTGVFHIIEHCIVEGSIKYPVQEWSERGPLKTFFSAFTSMDNTMYPVASCFEKSFQDLVKIYTDCVFAPNFLVTEYPFLKEGWHYEYDGATGKLGCRGIVYSEIKAAHDILDHMITLVKYRAAFPDSVYARDIGGSPEGVPQLTYQHFIDTYHTYFRPENCLVCLWGDASLYDVLSTLRPYFDNGQERRPQGNIEAKPGIWSGSPVFVEYPVVERSGRQDVLGFNWVFDNDRQSVIYGLVAAKLLETALAGRLTHKGICSQARLVCEHEPVYPMMNLILKGADREQLDTARQEIISAVIGYLSQEPDMEALAAAISSTEFDLREGPGLVPKGIQAALDATSAFVHGASLASALEYSQQLDNVRKAGWEGMADFIRRTLLENSRHTEYVMAASDTLAKREQEAEELRLTSALRNMDQGELSQVTQQEKYIEACQRLANSPEDMALLPRTSIGDMPERVPGKEIEIRPTPMGDVLFLPSSEELVRITLQFPVETFDSESLEYLGMLGIMFARVGAAGTSACDIKNQVSTLTGGIEGKAAWYAVPGGDRLFFNVTVTVLPSQIHSAWQILKRIVESSDYGDREALRLALTSFLEVRAGAIPDARARVLGYISHGGAASQYYSGLELERAVSRVLGELGSSDYTVIDKLAKTAKVLFSRRPAVSISCPEQLLESVAEAPFYSVLDMPPVCDTPLFEPSELFKAPGVMQYTGMGMALPQVTGGLLAACEAGDWLLREQLREIGGAYRVSLGLTRERNVLLQSDRDPHLASTIRNMRRISELIAGASDDMLRSAAVAATVGFNANGKASIGQYAMGRIFEKALGEYWNGLWGDTRQDVWSQLIASDPNSIRQAAAELKPLETSRDYCSWASEKKIAQDGGLFTLR